MLICKQHHPSPITCFAIILCAIASSSTAFQPSPSSTATRTIMNSSLSQFDADESDNDSHSNPRRGRPGIVVFSGGTAFNAASAEMASRIIEVGIAGDGNGAAADNGHVRQGVDANISRENSLVDLMTLGSLEMGNSFSPTAKKQSSTQRKNNNVGIYAGGTKVWHVLPVTDDGGSTAEIVRVLGGPAVGDIRSRLLRLAPGTTNEARAVRRLLGHRLISLESWREKHPNKKDDDVVSKEQISKMAREEWLDILEGYYSEGRTEHRLWKELSTPYRSIIRSFLVHFHTQVLQTHNGLRHSQSSPPFDFTGGSVGNFFFAGARTFFGSLPAAIFLFSKVAEIPAGSRVLPAILTEDRLVLGAELKNGQRIRGQYNISHPKPNVGGSNSSSSSGHRPVVKSGKIDSQEDRLSLHPSPISRIAYLLHDPTWQRNNQTSNDCTKTTNDKPNSKNSAPSWNDRHEINPDPNPLVLDAISNANCIVYGCGSLFTSVLPSLVLPGVGEAVADRDGLVPKILLLNGWHDRETSWSELEGNELIVKKMDATACVKAIVNALDQGGRWSNLEDSTDATGIEQSSDLDDTLILQSPPLVTNYITHVLYPIGTEIDIDEQSLLQYCKLRESICESYNRQQSSQSMFLQQQFLTSSKSNRRLSSENESIKFIGVQSIPANTCTEGSRSGGQTMHRIFHPPSLVDMILDLANGGNRPVSSL